MQVKISWISQLVLNVFHDLIAFIRSNICSKYEALNLKISIEQNAQWKFDCSFLFNLISKKYVILSFGDCT